MNTDNLLDLAKAIHTAKGFKEPLKDQYAYVREYLNGYSYIALRDIEPGEEISLPMQ